MTAAWLDTARNTPVSTVAGALGMAVLPARGASGGSIVGCPVCNSERRHASRRDRRGALGVRRDGRGWRCFACDASGDALDLIAYSLDGRCYAELSDSGKADLKRWCAERLGAGDAYSPPPTPSPPPAPPPDQSEVSELWDRCVRLDEDCAASAYLRDRGLRLTAIADFDLARALPADAPVSRWACFGGRPWGSTPYRIIVPLFDQHGRMRSVLARSVDREKVPKSVAPTGFSRAGLVMADGLARQLLASAARPAWWPAGQELRVLIAEGEPDYLAIASQWSDADAHAPATLGVVNGAWAREIAARVPDGAVVVICTHDDDAGERYAAAVATSFAGRSVQLERQAMKEVVS